MEKDFIDEFIPSKDTRAYLHSIHHEFTDLEKATIVANHLMISYEEKVKWLNAFMDKISDTTLKDRISKALIQIKKDRKYYIKCNTALGALPYNESLFDFVFIPHDFRHGDIVRSLYGGWNTTEFCEKVGIILNYFDKDYEFYKNLKGDYSDVQVCVDIKFDGVAYQGEFEHEHINPIYIERMTMNEKDERRAYLNYLTNLGSRPWIRWRVSCCFAGSRACRYRDGLWRIFRAGNPNGAGDKEGSGICTITSHTYDQRRTT